QKVNACRLTARTVSLNSTAMNMTPRSKATAAVFALFIIWTLATWFFEGRIDTLLRPDATGDRLLYAVVAKLIVGIARTIFSLRLVFAWNAAKLSASGCGSWRRSAAAVIIGFVFGLGFYTVAGGATSDPVVIANAFAQVLVVSAAEVLVCWAAVAATIEAVLRDSNRWLAIAAGAVIGSLLFGLYHFAHSAPFNSWTMVAFLSGI